jgi:hypothetical protein
MNQVRAELKGTEAEVGDAVRDGHIGQASPTVKSPISDAVHRLRNCHTGDAAVIGKRKKCDTDNGQAIESIGNDNVGFGSEVIGKSDYAIFDRIIELRVDGRCDESEYQCDYSQASAEVKPTCCGDTGDLHLRCVLADSGGKHEKNFRLVLKRNCGKVTMV